MRNAARGLGEARALDPQRVAPAGSTSESYSWIFKLLCEPGDEVVVKAQGLGELRNPVVEEG